MQEPVIRLEHVSKRFSFSEERPGSVLETLITRLRALRLRNTGMRPSSHGQRSLWAVQDVSFAVQPGESLGIVGRNGSGKSTLMKLITRILRPNEGRITVRGRVSALLELGAGFHPDLTGRENIYLNASVLGLQKADIEQHFDSVVAFSELSSFIDMPVKHYSSGMYMRLGFSVAVHVSPNILIVDEILAVGDQKFQEKCVARIDDMRRSGITVVLVSHNLEMMRRLCTHLVWMENGRLMAYGPTEMVLQRYLEFLYTQEPRQVGRQNGSFGRWGTGEIEITDVRLLDSEGGVRQSFRTNAPLTVEMDYLAHAPITDPEFGLSILHQSGVRLNGPNSRLAGMQTGTICGAGTVRYCIERLPLLPGNYLLTAAIHHGRYGIAYDFHKDAYGFEIVPGGNTEIDGFIEIPARWEWQPTAGKREA